jgi:von Willebrand factor type A domain
MTGLRLHRARGMDLRTWGAVLANPGPVTTRPGQRVDRPVQLPDLAGASPLVIRQLVDGLVVVFAIDGSASVHGPDGTDPYGTRNVACLSVVDLMRRYGAGRAGVVHWGSTAPADLALAPVAVHRARLRRALNMQPRLGGTNPAAALARVRQLVPMLGPGQTLVVLLLTDGQTLGNGLAEELALLPVGCVHLLLVDPSGDCYGQEAAWQALPWGSFTCLANLRDPRRVAWESGDVLARSIGLELPGPAPSRPSHQRYAK